MQNASKTSNFTAPAQHGNKDYGQFLQITQYAPSHLDTKTASIPLGRLSTSQSTSQSRMPIRISIQQSQENLIQILNRNTSILYWNPIFNTNWFGLNIGFLFTRTPWILSSNNHHPFPTTTPANQTPWHPTQPSLELLCNNSWTLPTTPGPLTVVNSATKLPSQAECTGLDNSFSMDQTENLPLSPARFGAKTWLNWNIIT